MINAANPPAKDVRALPERQAISFNIVDVLRRRFMLLMVTTVLGLGLGYVTYTRQTPIYQASARVHVDRRISNLPLEMLAPMSAASPMDQLLLTHTELIQSPVIAAKAAADPTLAGLTSFAGQRDVPGAIQRGIVVTRPRTRDNLIVPSVLVISYRSEESREAAVVLSAIVNAYVAYVRENEKLVANDAVTTVTKAVMNVTQSLELGQKNHREFREKNQQVGVGDKNEIGNLVRDNLVDSEKRLLELDKQRQELSAKARILQEAVVKGGPNIRQALEVLIGRQSEVARTNASYEARTREDQLLSLQMIELDLLAKYGPEHPAVLNVREKMNMVKQLDLKDVEKAKDRANKERANLPAISGDIVVSYINSLQIEDKILEQQYADLKKYVETKRPLAVKQSLFVQQDHHFDQQLTAQRELNDVLQKRLREIELVNREDGGIRVNVIAPPALQGEVAGAILRSMVLGGGVGFLLGLGLAYLAELADKCFRSPEEIRQTLGVPVMSHIPVIPGVPRERKDGRAIGMHKSLVTFHMSKSRLAEAYRSVRTALYFSTQGEEHKVIQVTSPEPSDGKTTLAANLAISIAQSGKRCVLVDADLRRPRIHKLFAVPKDRGLTTTIAGQCSLEEAVVPAPGVDNLFLMTSGELPANPSEILTSEAFDAMLKELAAAYDFVIVDTPPLLAVTDPSNVAPRVDGVLLALRMHKNARPQARRAVELLSGVNCKLLGVVVNGVGGPSGYGYGYGKYGNYSYGSYQYGYGAYSDYSGDNNYDVYYRTEENRKAQRRIEAGTPKIVAGRENGVRT